MNEIYQTYMLYKYLALIFIVEFNLNIHFNKFMDFKIKVIVDKKDSINTTISLAVPEEMKRDIMRIKKHKKDNYRWFNEYVRQFMAQLIEKYDRGELDPN